MTELNDEKIQVTSREISPGLALEVGETSFQVLSALDNLPENQQEVIRLKFQNGFSYRQISEITGHSVSNVGFLIHSGMKTLKAKFSQNGLMG